jgi:hypothetical protein
LAEKTELDTTNPLTAAANPGMTAKQVEMAGTQASKKGQLGLDSFNVTGNTHLAPSTVKPSGGTTSALPKTSPAPSVWSAPSTQTAVDAGELEKKKGIADAERSRQLQVQRDLVARDKESAQQQLQASQSLKQLGSIGESIQRQLAGNLNNIFKAEDQRLVDEGLDAISGSSELMGELAKSEQLKGASYTKADGTAVSGPDAVTAMFSDITEADKVLDDPTRVGEHDLATTNMDKAISQLATALALPGDTSGKVNWNTLQTIFADRKDELLGILASSAMADTVKVDDSLLADMGYDMVGEKAELTGLLRLTGQESMTEFRQKVDAYLSKDYSDVRQLESVLRDVTANPDERRQALEKLRDMGYTGALASREEVTRVADAVRQATDEGTTFQFAGRDYTLADALSDETITGAVADYLSGKLDREDLPSALADFVDENQKVFEAAVTELEKEVGEYNTRQEEWQTLKGLGLDDETMAMLGYDPKQKIQTGKLDTKSMPIVKEIMSGENTTANKGLLLDLQKNNFSPETLQKILKGMGAGEIKQLRENTDLRNNYFNSVKAAENFAQLDRDFSANPNMSGIDVIGRAFGSNTAADLEQNYNTLRELRDMGFTEFQPALDAMLAVSDLNNPKAIVAGLKSALSSAGIDDLNSFAGKQGDMMTQISSALGKAREAAKYVPLIEAVKSGNADRVANLAASSGLTTGNFDKDAELFNRLSKGNQTLASQLQMQNLGKLTTNSDSILSILRPGDQHNYSDSNRTALSEAKSNLVNIAFMSQSATPEVKEAAKAKLREFGKAFTERASDPGWGNVLTGSRALTGWKPKVAIPGFEGAFKGIMDSGGAFYPVKGGPEGNTNEYNTRSQDLVSAIYEYANMTGKPMNAETADEFAMFMNMIGG